jgi:hypothetical protein
MKRAFAIAAVVELLFVLLLFYSDIKDFIWTHTWWHSFLVAIPTIAVPILAALELQHSGEANTLRAKANDLQAENASLAAELDAERNNQLGVIARNTEKPVTRAERNASILRKHLRAKVMVYEEQGSWPNAAEVVEVSAENIVTLFTPRDHSSTVAWCVSVLCDELEISEIPLGSCPLRLKVLKRYGPNIQLGEITRWEDRLQPAATPSFSKGNTVHHTPYIKRGSPEKRNLYIYASSDGANSFLLEASTGEKVTGNNIEVSKRFLAMQVDYEAAGFRRNGGTGPGSSQPYQLFIY